MNSSLSTEKLRPEIHDLLSWLVSFEREQGRAPSISEVAYRDDTPERTSRYRLDRLAEHSLVRIEGSGHGRRAIVTEDGYQALVTGYLPEAVPYFESGAHAGEVGLELEASARHIRCLADLFSVLSEPEMCYFLPIKGDCMDGGRRPIMPGAEVLFWRCSRVQRPSNGALCHVELRLPNGETEALLREYFFDSESGCVTLRARNPEYADAHHEDSEVDPRGVAQKVIQDATGGETAAPEFGLPMLVDWAEDRD